MEKFTVESYEQKTNEDKLTVVKHAANWCGPCKMLTPVLDKVSQEFPNVNFGEVDIDATPTLAVKDGVRSVPTIVFYKNGQAVDRMTGLQPAQNYIDKINSLSN